MNPAKPLTAAIYARVSTTDQTCENQLRDLRAHAQQRGWQIAEEYVDAGISGAKESRPALDRLMKAAWSGQFQTVLVWRFDRFARSTKHLITALETFRSLGIAFTSLQEQIDTGTPIGEAMFTIIAALGKLERDVIRERIHAGLRRAKANGTKLGRPRTTVDMSRVLALKAQGRSMRAISRTLGLSAMTISRALSERNENPSAAAGRTSRNPVGG